MTPFEALRADRDPPFYYQLDENGLHLEIAAWKHHYIGTTDQVNLIVGPLVNTTLGNLRKIARHDVHSAGWFKALMEGPLVRTVDLADPQGLEHLEKAVKECQMISKIRPATSKGKSRTSPSSPGTPSAKKA